MTSSAAKTLLQKITLYIQIKIKLIEFTHQQGHRFHHKNVGSICSLCSNLYAFFLQHNNLIKEDDDGGGGGEDDNEDDV